MKKRFILCRTVLVVCAAALLITFGGVNSYAAEKTKTQTAKVTVTATPTPKPKKGFIKEKGGYRYYVKNKPLKNAWKRINSRYYWFKGNGYAAQSGTFKIKNTYYVFDEKARRLAPKKALCRK